MERLDNLEDNSLEIPQGKVSLMAKVLPEDSARIFTKTPFVDNMHPVF